MLPLAVGAGVYWLSYGIFAATREPRWPVAPPERPKPSVFLRDTFGVLRRDRNFRVFVTVRCLIALVGIFNLGLFAPYATKRLGIDEAMVAGLFTAVVFVGRIAAAIFSARVAQKYGYKATLVSGLVMLLVVLVAGLLLESAGGAAVWLLFLIYFLVGAQMTAMWMLILSSFRTPAER